MRNIAPRELLFYFIDSSDILNLMPHRLKRSSHRNHLYNIAAKISPPIIAINF